MVRIGIIDTGINANHPIFVNRPIQGVAIGQRGSDFLYGRDFSDCYGHGTQVGGVVLSFCPMAELFAVRVMGDSLSPFPPQLISEQTLVRAIDSCVERGIKIINISYSLKKYDSNGALGMACQKAAKLGAIIVAAYRNSDEGLAYPAAYSTVVGVRCRSDLNPGEVSIARKLTCDLFAWGRSNSIACAQVSAMIGRIHSVDSSLTLNQVFLLLAEVAVT